MTFIRHLVMMLRGGVETRCAIRKRKPGGPAMIVELPAALLVVDRVFCRAVSLDLMVRLHSEILLMDEFGRYVTNGNAD